MNKITKEKKNSKAGDRAAAGTKINSEFSLNKSSMVRTDIGDSDPEVRSNDLKELTAQWMQLERKTLEQRKNAAKFYDDYLMKPIEEEFVRNNQDMVFEEVEYMVVSVGTSYEPIVLDIRLLRPGRILFLYTEASQDTMAKVISYCGLGPNQYDKSIVSEIDPMDIYREIKSFYLRCGKPGKMYIDFTGGTKAMSAAAALAGAMIDVQMVYCSTDNFLVDFRKPNPGSERLMYIENPLAVFGEMEIEKAFELFDKYNFAGAKENFPFFGKAFLNLRCGSSWASSVFWRQHMKPGMHWISFLLMKICCNSRRKSNVTGSFIVIIC